MQIKPLPASTVVLVLCAGCGGNSEPPPVNSDLPPVVTPSFLTDGTMRTTYDGVTNDLLTGGLGKTGLAAAVPRAFADANNPTIAELRTRAIYNNYRALVDTSAAGGYGTLYGPNVNNAGVPGSDEGMIAGVEYVAFADDGTGTGNVTTVVQIPSTFNRNEACIVTATSSGSRGAYGAIGSAGEWGLKRGCAVAYTDKGTGNGAHELAGSDGGQVYLMDGRRASANSAGKLSTFTAPVPASELATFNSAFPNRWAFKHAHSRLNPEQRWGEYTLQAVELALYFLNLEFGPETPILNSAGVQIGVIIRERYNRANTLVIASSVSNGAAAALAAVEQDASGLIDGVAIAEPQVQVNTPPAIIRRGSRTMPGARSLFDYTTLANLYQPCAALSAAASSSPGLGFVPANVAAGRCQALATRGLVTGSTLAEQSDDAQTRLLDAGWEPESSVLHASLYAFATSAIAVTYANSYARASVTANLCGFSFAATAAGVPAALPATSAAQMWAAGNGIPPTNGVNIVNNSSLGGPLQDPISVSTSSGVQDFNIDGAVCLRDLLNDNAVRTGIDQVKRTGNLRGKPGIIVHGRNDGLVPVNHSSRPFYALNKTFEPTSRLVYVEVTNAQHFDAFIGNPALPGYDTRYVPLHRYLIQALDLVYDNLRNGTPLPPSQVVRTSPRGGTPGAAPAITTANVPPITPNPPPANLITFSGNVMTIPD
jgi:hydroxybutyrate-dimer hydrolase